MRQARRQASEDLLAPLSGDQRRELIELLSVLDDALEEQRTRPGTSSGVNQAFTRSGGTRRERLRSS
jgi:hypothetical protein